GPSTLRAAAVAAAAGRQPRSSTLPQRQGAPLKRGFASYDPSRKEHALDEEVNARHEDDGGAHVRQATRGIKRLDLEQNNHHTEGKDSQDLGDFTPHIE